MASATILFEKLFAQRRRLHSIITKLVMWGGMGWVKIVRSAED